MGRREIEASKYIQLSRSFAVRETGTGSIRRRKTGINTVLWIFFFLKMEEEQLICVTI